MPLSETALNELRSDLAELHRLQVRVNERIKALEAILTPFDFRHSGFKRDTAAQPALPDPKPLLHPLATKTMRAAILDVLEQLGTGRAPDVAREMESRGYPTEGKTRFTTRVYNELWRMSTEDHPRITGQKGLFKLAK